EAIVEVETDKATLEIPSPVAGVLTERLKAEGDAAAIGEVIARVDESGAAAGEAKPAAAQEPAAQEPAPQQPPAQQPAASSRGGAAKPEAAEQPQAAGAERAEPTSVLPAAQRLL